MNRTTLALPLTALLLAACHGGTATPTVSTLASVNGTVQGAPSGASTVKLLAIDTLPDSAMNPALASAPISASGTFTLSLPSAAAVTPLLSATSGSDAGVTNNGTCSGSISNSDPTSQAYSFSYLSVNGIPFSAATVTGNSTSATATTKGWIYVNKPTTLSGKVSCASTSGSVTDNTSFSVNMPLLQGWNVINVSVTVVDSSNGSFNTTINAVTGSDGPTTWTPASTLAQSVKPQLLRSQILNSSSLIQGAFSGHLKF